MSEPIDNTKEKLPPPPPPPKKTETANAIPPPPPPPTLKKKEPTLPSISGAELLGADTTLPSTDGALEQQSLPTIQNDLNPPGVLEKQPSVEQPKITEQPVKIGLEPVTSYQSLGDVNTKGQENPLLTSFSSGVASVGAMLARSPAYLADFTNKAINTINPIPQVTGMLPTNTATQENVLSGIAKKLEGASENLHSEANKEYLDKNGKELGISDYFDPTSEHFDISKGFGKGANAVAESMPVTIAIAAGSLSGLSEASLLAAGTVPMAAAEKQKLIQQNAVNKAAGLPEMDAQTIDNVSAISGALEMGTEAFFGNVKLGKVYKDIFSAAGKKAAQEEFKKGADKILVKALKPYLGNMVEEVASAGTNQLLDNLNHIYIGGDKTVKPLDNVMESMMIAIGSSGTLGAPTIPVNALNHVRQKADADKAHKIKEQQEKLRKEISENPDINPVTKSTLVTQLHGLNAEEDALIKKSREEHEALPGDKKEHVDNLLKKNSEIATAALDPNITKEAKDALVSQIDKNDEKIKSVYKENEKLIKEKEAAAQKEKETKKPEGPTPEQKEELDYLSHLKDSIGLDEVEQKRYDELSLTPEVKDSGVKTVETVSENKSPKPVKEETVSSKKEEPVVTQNTEEVKPVEQKKEVPRETPKGEIVKISGKEFERTIDKNNVATYKSVKDGVELPKDTEKYRQTEDARKAKQKPVESVTAEETPVEKQKAITKPKEELVDEEDLPVAKHDDVESVDKLNKDLLSMKQTDFVESKFSGMMYRAFKMKEEGKISRPTYKEYKKKAKDILGGRMDLDKEELIAKSEHLFEKIKEKLLGEGYKKIVLSSTAPITPQNIADLLDLTKAIVKRGISAGFTLKKAVDNASEAIKKHPLYKRLLATNVFDEKEFHEQVKGSFPEETPKPNNKVKKAKKRSTKSLSTNLYESENLLDDSKKIIKDQGLDREVYSNADANKNARKIVDEVGHAQALALAKDKNSDIPGGVRAMIFGHIINDLNETERKAKTPEEKNYVADMQANAAIDMEDFFIQFEKQSTDAGRFASAIGEFYKMSPLGMKKKMGKDLDRVNSRKKDGMRSAKKKFTSLKKELDAIDKEYAPKVEKPSPDKLKEIKERRSALFGKLKDSFGKLGFAATPENMAKLQHEQLKMIFDIAKTYFEEGAIRTKDLFSKLNKDIKKETGYNLSDEDMDNVLNQPYENKTFREAIAEKEAPIEKKEKREKQIKAIERALNKNIKQKVGEKLSGIRKVKTEAERLLDLHEKGVPKFFEDAFYEKFGLVDTNKEEVQKKLDEFSAKIANAPEGILKNNEQVKYLNWLKDYRNSKYLEVGMSAWYASILSSYETHARNLQFNGVTSLITMPLLLGQKAISKGNFKDAIKYYNEFFDSFGESMKEAKSIVKKGQTSRFEDVAPSNALERSDWTKWMVYPGRFLRASDILFTIPLYNMKQREIFSRIVDAEAKDKKVKLTPESREKAINDLMGNTEERKQFSDEQSKQEIEKIYGPEWQKDPEASLNQKIRANEIMDQSRPLEVREEARAWAKKALLTNKPEGFFGVMSDGIGFFLNHLPVLRAMVPFINVPLNIMNQIIERSPAGIIKIARGKVWFDKEINGKNYGRELTPEEKKELKLKCANYSILLGAVAMAAAMGGGLDDDDDKANFIVTGKEGDYFRNQSLQKGGGLEPYTVYIGGKDGVKFNYQNTPLASIFSPVGFYRDYKKYEDTGGDKNIADGIAHSTVGFLNQIIDAASMKGMKEIFKYADAEERKRMADDGYKKEVAKKLNTLFPYSGLVKATTKDVRGLIGVSEKAPHDFVDYLVGGLPFDYYQDHKVDILGRDVKSQFDIPIIPYQKKNLSEQGQEPDKYYEGFRKKNYDPTTKFIKTKNAYTDKRGEFILTKKELYDLNKERGEIALKLLNKKDKSGTRLWDKMEKMTEGRFADHMNKVLQTAQDMAKIKTFVLDGKLPEGKSIKSIYRKYKKTIQKDKTKEKPINVL